MAPVMDDVCIFPWALGGGGGSWVRATDRGRPGNRGLRSGTDVPVKVRGEPRGDGDGAGGFDG